MMDVGGDFIDILYRAGEPHLGVFICDVSGHGVAAAFLSSMVKMALNDWDSLVENPSELLYSISKSIRKKLGSNFLTATAGYLNLETGTFTYASAGHPEPILISDGKASCMERKGGAIWEFSESEFPIYQCDLKSGDRIVFYTDGISEVANSDGKMMSKEELLHFFENIPRLAPSEFCAHVVNEVERISGSSTAEAVSDDLSILAFDFLGTTDTAEHADG
jgi:serine phosphatase RsbU (regulator of sigma subunit)